MLHFQKGGSTGKPTIVISAATEDVPTFRSRSRNNSNSVPVSPNYKQRDVEASLAKTKSFTSRDEGDGLRKGLLGSVTTESSSKSLFGGSSSRGTASEGAADLDLSPDAPMVDVVKAIITLTRVENAVWTEGNSHKKWQVG